MIAWLLFAATLAHATEVETFTPEPLLGRPIANLRGGLGSGAEGALPVICGEITPTRRLSVEGCGNGAGVLHHRDVPDMAHFRARVAVLQRAAGRLEADLVVGAGLAEVQASADAPGFRFGPAAEGQVEAAGPEVSTGARGRYWFADGTYLTVDATIGVATIPGAPTAVGTGPTIGFGGLTAGLGF